MKKTVISIKQFFTQQELGITCIKPIKGEIFGRLRSRDIWVGNKNRVISKDFQGFGYERELIPIDTGDGYTISVRRKQFNPSNERLNKIVAEVYLEKPDNCKTVRSLDGDRYNCIPENLYYYYGRMEKAGRGFPKADIFDYDEWFPFLIGGMEVNMRGIVATTKKAKWDKGERLRRFETMKITEVEETVNGYAATVVDGGGAVSTFEMKDGHFILKTSWGSCITVGSVNQPIVEASDLTMILNSIKELCIDLIKNEAPMELADVHIENMELSMDALESSETAISMAA